MVLRHSCWCFGTSDRCFGTPAGATCCVSRHVLIGAPALLLVLRHSCCVGRHVLNGAPALLLVLRHSCWCFGTSDRCFATPAGATCCVSRHVLIGAPALLLVLRHSCWVGRHVLNGAPALLLVLRHSCSVLYLRVLIILRPTRFL